MIVAMCIQNLEGIKMEKEYDLRIKKFHRHVTVVKDLVDRVHEHTLENFRRIFLEK